MNWSLLILVPVLAVPVAHGISRAPLWTLFVLPGLAQIVGYYGVVTEPSNYDMHGFTLVLTLMAGGIWLAVSLLARWARAATQWVTDRPTPRHGSGGTEPTA